MKTSKKAKRQQRALRQEQARKRKNLRPAYEAYISSEHWTEVKNLKAQQEPKLCANCGSMEEIHCHHMCYREPLESVKLTDLMWLCAVCHEKYHSRTALHLSANASSSDLIRMTFAILRGEAFKPETKHWKERKRRGSLSKPLNGGRPIVVRYK